MKRVLILAGEVSGDERAAELVRSLVDEPISFLGMGGSALLESGVDVRIDARELSVIGFFEVLRILPKVFFVRRLIKKIMSTEKIDLLVCVDYQKFNLSVAKMAKKLGVPVLFYVSPQIWASRPKRAAVYGNTVDVMATLFPFEPDYYAAYPVKAVYVGHPLVSQISRASSLAEVRRELCIPLDQKVITFMPGSRRQEIGRLLPVMVLAYRRISKLYPEIVFLCAAARDIDEDSYANYLQGTSIRLLPNHSFSAAIAANWVVAASGTATLELALLLKPMIVIYKVHFVSAWLIKKIIEVPYISLPNILLNRRLVPELLQEDCTDDKLYEVLLTMIETGLDGEIEQGLERVRKDLSVPPQSSLSDLVLGLLK